MRIFIVGNDGERTMHTKAVFGFIITVAFAAAVGFLSGIQYAPEPEPVEPEPEIPVCCDCQKLDELIEHGWTYETHSPKYTDMDRGHYCKIRYSDGDHVYVLFEKHADSRKEALDPCVEKAMKFMKGMKNEQK
jgi:hypothetical protein